MKQKLLTDIELDVHELKYLMDSFTKEPTPTLSELLKRSITRMQGRLDELQQEVDAVQVISPSAVEETAEEEDEVAGSEEDSPVIIQSLESVVVKEDEEGEAIVAEEKPVVIAAAAETAAAEEEEEELEQTEEITPYKNPNQTDAGIYATYEAVLIPQQITGTDKTIQVKVGDAIYNYEIKCDNGKFSGGENWIYNITVKENELEVSIDYKENIGWGTNGNTGSGEVELP